MGRCAIVILISGLMTFTCGMLGPVPTRAQESTPAAATGVEISPGVTFELMPASEDPPSLYRLRFAPGATLAFVDDPGDFARLRRIGCALIAAGRRCQRRAARCVERR